MGTLIGMILISFMLCIPDMRYAINMTRKGHGYVAINNSFSAQILTISLGLGIPSLVYSLRHHNIMLVPAHYLVAEASLFLGIGVFVFIGLTLVPALIKKEESCKLDDLRGKVLLGTAALLIVAFIVISFRSRYFVCIQTNSNIDTSLE